MIRNSKLSVSNLSAVLHIFCSSSKCIISARFSIKLCLYFFNSTFSNRKHYADITVSFIEKLTWKWFPIEGRERPLKLGQGSARDRDRVTENFQSPEFFIPRDGPPKLSPGIPRLANLSPDPGWNFEIGSNEILRSDQFWWL